MKTNQNISKSNMTYENLINSFVKYPGQSRMLYKIFNPFIATLIFAVISISLGYLVDNLRLSILITSLTAVFILKYYIFHSIAFTGHGVGLRDMGKFRILKLSQKFSILYLGLIVISIIGIIYFQFASDFDPTGRLSAIYTFFVFLVGVIFSILIWRFYTYYLTWYGSEYAAIKECKNKGYSKSYTYTFLVKLYKAGILFDEPKESKINQYFM